LGIGGIAVVPASVSPVLVSGGGIGGIAVVLASVAVGFGIGGSLLWPVEVGE
jgi:hypothetical protein